MSQDTNASGCSLPIWYCTAQPPDYPPLTGPHRVEVCIVGAGIAGLTCAYLLAKAGRDVLLIDEKPVAGGESGRTSAHLSSAVDDGFYLIERLHGETGAKIQYESHAAAIDTIERIVQEEDIDCDFLRVDGYLIPAEGDRPEKQDRELGAALRAGAVVERVERPPVAGLGSGPCLRFARQARFHPIKYLTGLARAIERLGGTIRCGTRVMNISGDGATVTVTTQAGDAITASAAVAATNVPSPIGNWIGIYTKSAPYRTYMIAVRVLKGSVADSLYWDTGDSYHFVRIEPASGDAAHDVLLVGGEDHKTGQQTTALEELERFERLESWARGHFAQAKEVLARWSGQVIEPDDGVAFIGRVPTSGHDNCYVITGDSGMGLTHGTLGAQLVTDQIMGRTNPWARLYEPGRKMLMPGALKEFARENLNMAFQYIADYLSPGEVLGVDAIKAGHGALIRRGLHKIAAYRDQEGVLHEMSAACTHLKGVVQWNELEQSWDCPCHGSRFDALGKVLTGPATQDLPAV